MASKRKAEVEDSETKKAKSEDKVKEEFQEQDAPKDTRASMKSPIQFPTADSTLNVLSTWGGKVLTPVTEGGMAFFMAGARANVGQTAGRYMFEVKIVQVITTSHTGTKPRQTLRIGFSTSEADLVFGAEHHQSMFFDIDGLYSTGNTRTVVGNGRVLIARDVILAAVLNLDPKSPNHNTIAFYKDGARLMEPKPIPEELHGKVLFPHLNFRSMTVQVNMGPTPLKELPFKCRMLQGAAASDVSVAPSKEPKDGKYEVVLPVAFPNEGTFDWVDKYIEKNPTYVELSDRKIIEWAKRSGLVQKIPQGGAGSNDRPKGHFGIPSVDDFSVRKVIGAVAPLVPRNYIVMEVKANLLKDERREIAKRFSYPCFKKVAHVVMGEPPKEWLENVLELILTEKQQLAEAQWKKGKAAKEKERLLKKRKEEIELKRGQAAKKKKKEEATEDEIKEEEVDEKKDVTIDEDDDEPPEVELDENEKILKFRPTPLPDLDEKVFGSSVSKFSIPDEDEKFDNIRYEWAPAKEARAYLHSRCLSIKSTIRIEDLKPGDAFKTKYNEFVKLYADWHEKQSSYSKASKKDSNFSSDADIYMVDDIVSVKNGCPLFEHFGAEDWALVRLRVEFYLMLYYFPKDTDDADREGILLDHLEFYYGKYYQKKINPKAFNKDGIGSLIALIPDTVGLKDSLVVSQLSDDLQGLDMFVRITEEQRRERQRRIDAGDETVRLKFITKLLQAPKAIE